MSENSSDDTWTTLAMAGLAVLAANAFGVFQDDKSKAKKLYERSLEAQQAGQFTEAMSLLVQCIQKDDTHAPAFNNLAWLIALHQNMNAIGAAQQYAQHALQFASTPAERADYLDTLGEVYLLQGHLDEAIQCFRECLRMNPNLDATASDYGPSFRLGFCYFRKKDWRTAHEHVTRAAQVGSANPFVYGVLGQINMELNSYHHAVQSFDEAIRRTLRWTFHIPLSPPMPIEEWRHFTRSNFYCQLGTAHYRLKNIDACREACQRAIAAYPGNPEPQLVLASLSAREDVAKMRAYLEDGLRLIALPQHDFLIRFLLDDPNFEDNRNIVYEMLRAHDFISQSDFVHRLRIWDENRIRANEKGSDVSKEQHIHIDTFQGILGGGGKIENSPMNIAPNANASANPVAQAFSGIVEAVNRLPDGSDKDVAQSAVKALYAEAQKGEEASENTVRRYLDFLVQTAPDAWEVAINTLINPIQGVSTVMQKIAIRAKEERGV